MLASAGSSPFWSTVLCALAVCGVLWQPGMPKTRASPSPTPTSRRLAGVNPAFCCVQPGHPACTPPVCGLSITLSAVCLSPIRFMLSPFPCKKVPAAFGPVPSCRGCLLAWMHSVDENQSNYPAYFAAGYSTVSPVRPLVTAKLPSMRAVSFR